MSEFPLMDTTQLSELIQTNAHTVRSWRRIGKGPKFFQISERKVFYRREDVEQWLNEKYQESNPPTHCMA